MEPRITYKYAVIGLLCAGAPLLLAIPSLKACGWALFGLVALLLAVQWRSRFARHMGALATALALLGLTPINTDISYAHMLGMGAVLALAVAGPYLLTTRLWREQVIMFPLTFGRAWYKREIAYVFFAGAMSYLILPYYLGTTGSYQNWGVVLDPSHIARLFVGTNALGIWDEVFFVGVCLALLRQHVPFLVANMAQATLWTTFLYELGFRGWGPYAIFFFALSQGYIFKRSKSLLYIITVHLTLDFVLFLVLVHLHHPHLLRIFITSPF